jgi:hypothetical protein
MFAQLCIVPYSQPPTHDSIANLSIIDVVMHNSRAQVVSRLQNFR